MTNEQFIRAAMNEPKVVEMPAPDWRSGLDKNKWGNFKPTLDNAVRALRTCPEWSGVIAWNLFTGRVECRKRPPWDWRTPASPEWTDNDTSKITVWLQQQKVYVPPEVAGRAAYTVASENPYHPIREWLMGLKWDGRRRVHEWLTVYLGADDNAYVSAVGQRWLVSAVARIMEPGCKADTALILEGKQGLGKSTALKVLFDPWFIDHLPDLTTKDAVMQLAGAWCVEVAEWDSFRKADLNRVKSFMSTSVDKIRLPYGRETALLPRQTVMAATTNADRYLVDETGNRRFWPVSCGDPILVPELRRDREQLFAEALLLYRERASWWLDTPELAKLADAEQQERLQPGVWDDLIARWLTGRTETSVTEVLRDCIKKPEGQWSQADMNAVARCLKAHGWIWRRVTRDGARVCCYQAPYQTRSLASRRVPIYRSTPKPKPKHGWVVRFAKDARNR